MGRLTSNPIRQILLINIKRNHKLKQSLREEYLPVFVDIFSNNKSSFEYETTHIRKWQDEVIIQYQSIRQFFIRFPQNLFINKFGIVAVLCDYNQRQQKLFLMILTFFCRAKLRVALYSNNQYTILSLKYLFKVISTVIFSCLKSLILKTLISMILIFCFFSPSKSPQSLNQGLK
jgi:hypothetical protein